MHVWYLSMDTNDVREAWVGARVVLTTWKVIREIWGTQKVLFFEINRLWKRP